ncbi:MAG: hypothetical protein ACXVB6_12310 [Mucilaginibacter sp.]
MATKNNSKIDNFTTITEFRNRKLIEAEGVVYEDLPPVVQAVIKDLSVTVETLQSVISALSIENGTKKGMGCLGL